MDNSGVEDCEPNSLEFCRKQVRIDFERAMGITEALRGKLSKETLQLIKQARKAIEAEIEPYAVMLYDRFRYS